MQGHLLGLFQGPFSDAGFRCQRHLLGPYRGPLSVPKHGMWFENGPGVEETVLKDRQTGPFSKGPPFKATVLRGLVPPFATLQKPCPEEIVRRNRPVGPPSASRPTLRETVKSDCPLGPSSKCPRERPSQRVPRLFQSEVSKCPPKQSSEGPSASRDGFALAPARMVCAFWPPTRGMGRRPNLLTTAISPNKGHLSSNTPSLLLARTAPHPEV
ncbi:hypothetical protein M885DRAFT_28544 [Pelagophyceae sp. CCMP2097]|nr:hypothetical protein M885DRAFT_28544 [Pelagophyceae sp. CCMP2097]